jgi:hypothetical protein
MKSRQILVGILGLSLALGGLAGCKTEGEEAVEAVGKFEGSWRSANATGTFDVEYEFKGNEFTCYVHHNDLSFSGTFSYTETEITFIRSTTNTWTQKYTIADNVLVLEIDEGSHFNGRFTKQDK